MEPEAEKKEEGPSCGLICLFIFLIVTTGPIGLAAFYIWYISQPKKG